MTAVDRARWPYRMKDLCERTGLPRQAIHFYIQQGLLPEGHKPGRNMAYYGEEHVERLLLIRRLQQERFLPLKAIRAILEDRDEVFSPEQRRLLTGLRSTLGSALGGRSDRTVPVAEILARLSLSRADFEGLVEANLLASAQDAAGQEVIAADDVWLLEHRAALRDAGFNEDIGFRSQDMALYEEVVRLLLAREAQLIGQRLVPLPPERIAAMLERGLPIVNDILVRLHNARVKSFIETL